VTLFKGTLVTLALVYWFWFTCFKSVWRYQLCLAYYCKNISLNRKTTLLWKTFMCIVLFNWKTF